MEVAGLVVGIVSLYSACQSCYNLYSEARDSKANVTLAAHQLEIHGSILKAWAFYWEIKLHDPNLPTTKDSGNDQESANTKLRRYLERNPYKAKGIASTLYCIGDALSDKKKLLKDYGLEVDLNDAKKAHNALSASTWKDMRADVVDKAQTITSRFTPTRKFTWVLKDSAKFNVLIESLKKHNDSLHLLCPEFAFELLLINVALDYLPRHGGSDLHQLKQLSFSSQVEPLSAGGENVRGGGQVSEAGIVAPGKDTGEILPLVSSPSQEGLQVVADLANIKIEAASSSEEKQLSLDQERELLFFKQDDLDIGDNSMAVWLSGRETVYLEMHSYDIDDDALSKRIRTNILKLGRLLKLPVCTKRLHTLELLGLVEFRKDDQFGFVYRLPYALGQLKKGFPLEDMKMRKPRATLLNWAEEQTPALGLRFNLARKLVQSVSFLHASGWLHKNIRTDEFYVFPKLGPEPSRQLESTDFENPFLLGYRYSRPDDERYEAPPVVSEVPMPIQSQEGEVSLKQSSQDRANPSTSKAPKPKIMGRRARFALEDNGDPASHPDTYVPERSLESHRVNLDMKHHPIKRAFPDRRYCYAFDVYSLGIALLEIGLWMPVEELLDSEKVTDVEHFDTRRELIRITQDRLPYRCGERYTKVTISCLSVDPEDSEESLIEQRELCARTAADLAQCQV